jgi:hypothetical protein
MQVTASSMDREHYSNATAKSLSEDEATADALSLIPLVRFQE